MESSRNTVYASPEVNSWYLFLMYYLSVESQEPKHMFAIGGLSYLSTITNADENLPISNKLKAQSTESVTWCGSALPKH